MLCVRRTASTTLIKVETLLSGLISWVLRHLPRSWIKSRAGLDEHLQVSTLEQYAEALVAVTQQVFRGPLLDRACKELARKAKEPNEIWFEVAADIFARLAVTRQLPDGQYAQYLAAFKNRISEYHAALLGSNPASQAPRMVGSSIGVTDPFAILRFGSIQIPLLMILKDAVSHIHLKAPPSK